MSVELEAIQKEAYKMGFKDGLECFAHSKDGDQLVGTSPPMKLSIAIEEMETLWNFRYKGG